MPFKSLANALVRDGTSRFFRWRRRAKVTRTTKVPITSLTGTFKRADVSVVLMDLIQTHMRCGCRLSHSVLDESLTASIGGKRFHAGERLRLGIRCGSVITMVRGGRSIYGLAKRFYRVVCACDRFVDLVSVTWFPLPDYPDGHPLTVRIVLNGLDVNMITEVEVVRLSDIQPSRVGVEIDREQSCMFMLRMDGTDTIPVCTN